jgi:hypothetical protein
MRDSKHDFPVHDIRRFLEPGPVVLVSSFWRGKTNIMTMGWHTVLEFSPSLIGCLISRGNHSHEMVRRSRECVISVPTVDLATKVVDIGNCSGATVDKFARFKLTPAEAQEVKAPLISNAGRSMTGCATGMTSSSSRWSRRTRPQRRNIPGPSITAATACSWSRAARSTCGIASVRRCFDGLRAIRVHKPALR